MTHNCSLGEWEGRRNVHASGRLSQWNDMTFAKDSSNWDGGTDYHGEGGNNKVFYQLLIHVPKTIC